MKNFVKVVIAVSIVACCSAQAGIKGQGYNHHATPSVVVEALERGLISEGVNVDRRYREIMKYQGERHRKAIERAAGNVNARPAGDGRPYAAGGEAEGANSRGESVRERLFLIKK